MSDEVWKQVWERCLERFTYLMENVCPGEDPLEWLGDDPQKKLRSFKFDGPVETPLKQALEWAGSTLGERELKGSILIMSGS